MRRNTILAISIAGALLLAASAAATASYMTKKSAIEESAGLQPKKTAVHRPAVRTQQQASAQPVAAPLPPCNDHNIVGTIAGGAAGGLIGSQIGKGSGKTAATIGGAVGGAYLGNQYVPTRNATCR